MSPDPTNIEIGSVAPDMELESNRGALVRLSDYRSRKLVVLYFIREFN